MTNKQKGFTLIELLVVIAIIGILAALVLVSLGNARSKAQDARIKSDVAQIRTLAEIHFDAIGAYNNGTGTQSFGDCVEGSASDCQGGTAASVASLTTDITSAGGTVHASTGASTTAFCVAATLASAAGDKQCVDSTGRSITTQNATPCTAAFVCQ
jgi:prepilin-type N-terminal cleavage/methylation domain-containing protein